MGKVAKKISVERGFQYWYLTMESAVEKILTRHRWKLVFLAPRQNVLLETAARVIMSLRPALIALTEQDMKFPPV